MSQVILCFFKGIRVSDLCFSFSAEYQSRLMFGLIGHFLQNMRWILQQLWGSGMQRMWEVHARLFPFQPQKYSNQTIYEVALCPKEPSHVFSILELLASG